MRNLYLFTLIFSCNHAIAFTPSLFYCPSSTISSSNKRCDHVVTSSSSTTSLHEMREIAEGVEFDTICREWRCKWSPNGDKASLVACQMALESVAEDLFQVDGVKSVERVVCGDCLDFKVITSLSADKFDAWKQDKFDPEEFFLEMLHAVDGVSQIETQTYTKMPVLVTEFSEEE